jgi:hypothetical protein
MHDYIYMSSNVYNVYDILFHTGWYIHSPYTKEKRLHKTASNIYIVNFIYIHIYMYTYICIQVNNMYDIQSTTGWYRYYWSPYTKEKRSYKTASNIYIVEFIYIHTYTYICIQVNNMHDMQSSTGWYRYYWSPYTKKKRLQKAASNIYIVNFIYIHIYMYIFINTSKLYFPQGDIDITEVLIQKRKDHIKLLQIFILLSLYTYIYIHI